MRRVRKLADKAASLPERDADVAFFGFFAYAVGEAAARHAYAEVPAEATMWEDGREPSPVGRESAAALDALLVRAQRARAVRQDIDTRALIALMVGTARAAEHVDPATRGRLLDIVFDGLRASPAGAYARAEETHSEEKYS
ncbi:hypothetical protein [Sphaerimonospora mesophila]|uniref:SbtR family transcriptional regulator n=1 Tax=Sphaerimonospora mesophila TaxID=37483 RepID=UPI0006E1EC8A